MHVEEIDMSFQWKQLQVLIREYASSLDFTLCF